MILWLCLFFSSGTNCDTNVKRHTQKYNETFALESFVQMLKSDSLNSAESLIETEFFESLKYFDRMTFFSNGKLCLITEPIQFIEDDDIGYEKQMHEEFLADFRQLNSSEYSAEYFELPPYFKKMDFSSYMNNPIENSYYFIVRRRLESLSSTMVEIHLVPFNNVENPFAYTFHLYIKGGALVNVIYSKEGDFEYHIDC